MPEGAGGVKGGIPRPAAIFPEQSHVISPLTRLGFASPPSSPRGSGVAAAKSRFLSPSAGRVAQFRRPQMFLECPIVFWETSQNPTGSAFVRFGIMQQVR
jgi:hypothetical protein